MDGIHDLGGTAGFGAIIVEPNEPAFHHAWEATAWALNMLAISRMRAYNTDAYRHALERMDPSWYLEASYYERVLTGVTTLLVESGVVSLEELEDRAGGPVPLSQPVSPTALPIVDVIATIAAFVPGDVVRVIAASTRGHSRCPQYVRGHVGTVVRVYPLAHYPEARAHSTIKLREHTYAVEFSNRELWDDADPNGTVVIELFEQYLAKEQREQEQQ